MGSCLMEDENEEEQERRKKLIWAESLVRIQNEGLPMPLMLLLQLLQLLLACPYCRRREVINH